MPAKTLMVQGTASSVGKSIIVTALCRIFRQGGLKVAPFKAQNMALNSFVTRGGGEIGRAQAVQAEAAGIEASVDMNPVLIKPEADSRSQIVVLGKVAWNLRARDYYQYTPRLISVIEESLAKLRSQYDIIVIEGAGSPAEINLKEREIVNMRVAKMAHAPVLLVGDIDRGGVFASMVGTLELLDADERELIRGLIINKFRGDVSLLRPGLDFLEKKSGKPVLGVVPFFKDIKVAQEDSVWLDERRDAPAGTGLDVVVIRLPHMSNYDDFDPLAEMGCAVRYVGEAGEIGRPDLIIVPGTKTTVVDLLFMRERGIASAVVGLARTGTPVVGVCGGFQMLGKRINDPLHVESREDGVEGLGLLDIETTFASTKTTTQVRAKVMSEAGLLSGLRGAEVSGYEIHMGQTDSVGVMAAFEVIETPEGKRRYADGATSDDGNIFGSYIHGMFHNALFTRSLLDGLRERKGLPAASAAFLDKERQYDELADVVRDNLDMDRLYRIVRE